MTRPVAGASLRSPGQRRSRRTNRAAGKLPMPYETPDNLVELLDGIVNQAAQTAFYSSMLNGHRRIRNPEDFGNIPVTSLETYRRQRFADVLAEPSKVEWIVGPYKGQSPDSVAVAEGPEEEANRYELLTDAVKDCISLQTKRTCAVVTSPEKRYFASEVATILINAGIPSHVFTDKGTSRTYELVEHVSPEVVVLLSDNLSETRLPEDTELCITFRRSHILRAFQQLDVYIVDELGFLGHSTDCESYKLNRDVYYFERSEGGNLIVTSLYKRVQPMLRIETMDKVAYLGNHALEFTELSPSP